MSLAQIYKVGLNNVGSYQVAGRPYLSGAIGITSSASSRFIFPQVTKSITVKNNDSTNNLFLAFAPSGAAELTTYDSGSGDTDNYFIIKPAQEFSFNVKCKEIFLYTPQGSQLMATASVYAELTEIPDERMYSLDQIIGVNL